MVDQEGMTGSVNSGLCLRGLPNVASQALTPPLNLRTRYWDISHDRHKRVHPRIDTGLLARFNGGSSSGLHAAGYVIGSEELSCLAGLLSSGSLSGDVVY